MEWFAQYRRTRRLVSKTKYTKTFCCTVAFKTYDVTITRRAANKHTVIHCRDGQIVWQQIPRLFNWGGSLQGEFVPIHKCTSDKTHGTVFVVKGRPGGIVGLDDGPFSCADRFDENGINVMTYRRFKRL